MSSVLGFRLVLKSPYPKLKYETIGVLSNVSLIGTEVIGYETLCLDKGKDITSFRLESLCAVVQFIKFLINDNNPVAYFLGRSLAVISNFYIIIGYFWHFRSGKLDLG